jgi:glucose-1-phosphate adenylyltransferase
MTIASHQKKPSIASVILAGGKGTRLYPLTIHHSKPAIRYGGKYRLIDIPLSNSLNSNIQTIFVIGQYLTAELQHHLDQTYQFDSFFPSIDFLSPDDHSHTKSVIFEGTADAIRKNLDTILKTPVDYFLILSGDQLYNVNFQHMLDFAIKNDANLTIASIPICMSDAKRMGVLEVDKKFLVTDFLEKPQKKEELEKFALSSNFFAQRHQEKKEKTHLGSMGIYIFKRETLKRLLLEDQREDFGHHLIPTEIPKKKTFAYVYDGYWEDIGTIDSFYKANIALTSLPSLGLKTYDEKNPIYCRIHYLPGTKIQGTTVSNSIICEGSIVEAKEINNSVIGLRSHIKKGTVIHDSIVMGNNFYLSPEEQTFCFPERFEIGENCLIQKTIIDEHVSIGNNVKLINQKGYDYYDSDGIYVRDGIIIVTACKHLPNNFVF